MRWRHRASTWAQRLQFWRTRGRTLSVGRGRGRVAAALSVSLQDASERRKSLLSDHDIDPIWDEAFMRVENYLRAHQIESRIQLTRLTTRIITEARQLAAEQPAENPVELAMHILHLQLGSWFVRAFNEGDWADERFQARGRLSLMMTGLVAQHPQHFLADETLPAELAATLKAASLQPGPEVRFSNMPPAPLEFTLLDSEQPGWTTFSPRPFVGASVVWILTVGLLSAAWIVTH